MQLVEMKLLEIVVSKTKTHLNYSVEKDGIPCRTVSKSKYVIGPLAATLGASMLLFALKICSKDVEMFSFPS